MISATSIHFNNDGTLWVVIDRDSPFIGIDGINAHILDRPCDTCDGRKWCLGDDTPGLYDAIACPDCDGTGRHTFPIEVECWTEMCRNGRPGYWADGGECGYCMGTTIRTLRVSVVPGMVLPIYDECPDLSPADHVCKGPWGDEQWTQHRSFDNEDWTERRVTLPPDAKPGMYAMKVRVHV